jgi:hypothetical protein
MDGKTAFFRVVGIGCKDGGKSARRSELCQLEAIGKAREPPRLAVAVETYIVI